MNIAIIPARGGSKRIARKNIREFCGASMISYAIKTAFASGIFDRVIVSTEDSEIASISLNLGAEVPFVRPSELADDHVSTIDTIAHAVSKLGLTDYQTQVCCLYPATPLLHSSDLQGAYARLTDTAAEYIFAACEYRHPIQRALLYKKDGFVMPVCLDSILQRTQDLEVYIHDAGQFYFGKAASFLKKVPILGPKSMPYILPQYRIVDIDTPEDWAWAERLYLMLYESRISC